MMFRNSIIRVFIPVAILLLAGCASNKDGNSSAKTAATQNTASSGASSSQKSSSSTGNSASDDSDFSSISSYSVDGPASMGKSINRPSYGAVAMKAVDDSANDVEDALELADTGKTAAAISSLKVTTAKYPNSFIAHYDLGILYERQSDDATARACYKEALKAEPSFTPALIQLVRLDIRNNNVEGAKATADQYIAANPEAFDHNYAKIEALIANKEFDTAISMCRALLKKDEANATLRYYIAATEYERGRYRLAEFIIGESLEIDPNDPEALFMRARIHDALSQEDVSLVPSIASDLDKVIELNPDHLEALWMRGVIYYEASNYKKAEQYFRAMIDLSPKTVSGYINLANTLKTLDRGPEAEKLLKQAKALDPKNGLVDFSLGTLYLNIELIKLPDMKDMDRLKLARVQFENAQNNWTSKDDIALAKGYIRTTDDAIETLQAMLDAEALFGASSSSSDENTDFKVDDSGADFMVD